MVQSCIRGSLLLTSMLLLAPWFTARAEEARTALVINNTRYAFAPLVNPGHDAADIADALLAQASPSISCWMPAGQRCWSR